MLLQIKQITESTLKTFHHVFLRSNLEKLSFRNFFNWIKILLKNQES